MLEKHCGVYGGFSFIHKNFRINLEKQANKNCNGNVRERTRENYDEKLPIFIIFKYISGFLMILTSHHQLEISTLIHGTIKVFWIYEYNNIENKNNVVIQLL